MYKALIHIAFIILVILLSNNLSAQEKTNQKVKVYNTWVKLKNNSTQVGLLYEIEDSSITIIKKSLANNYYSLKTDTIRIDYKEIRNIKARRIKNIKKGLLIGSATGYTSGVIYALTLLNGEDFAGLIALEIGFGYAILGAGVGVIAGSIKDRIPVKGSLKNFNLYRSVLEDYSIIQETPKSNFVFEHKAFIDLTLGPAFTIGNLKNLSTGTNEVVKPGFNGNITIGYRLTRRFGVSFSQMANEYSIDKNLSTINWGLESIMVGPILSKPIGKNTYFDFNPSIGYSTMDFYIWDIYGKTIYEKVAKGFGLNINTSLTYYISNQWGFSAKAAYLFSHQNYNNKQQENYNSFNISFGVVFRFSRKSL